MQKKAANPNDNLLEGLHVGKMIQELAIQKGISAKQIALVINHDTDNADKIFKMDDMYTEDILKISKSLEYDILSLIVEKYLSPHLFCYYPVETEQLFFKIDEKSRHLIPQVLENNCENTKDILIGNHILKIANKNNLKQKDLAERLCCTQSMISYLFHLKKIKIKKLIIISIAMQYDFISNVYLSQIKLPPSIDFLKDYEIYASSHQITFKHVKDKTNLMIFKRKDAKN